MKAPRLGRLLHPRAALQRLAWRLSPESLRQITGSGPRQVFRLSSIALAVGDFRAARDLTAPVGGVTTEHALAINLIAEWETDDQAAALERAEAQVKTSSVPQRRAAARFFTYIEDPGAAERALGPLHPEANELALAIAQCWARQGEHERALQLLDQLETIGTPDPSGARLRESVAGELDLRRRAQGGTPGPRSAPGSGPILHLVSRSLPHHHAGSTYRTHYLARAQRAAGLDAQVVTGCGFPSAAPTTPETFEDVTYHRLAGGATDRGLGGQFDHHLQEADRLVANLRPSVLHPASDYRNCLVALELGERHDLPVVYEVRGFPEEYVERRPGSRLRRDPWASRREMELECWRRSDRIITLAEVMKRHIAAKGVDPDKISVVPNAVDVDRFAPAPKDARLASQLGIEPGEPVIGYVSSLSPYEGIRYLIEAVGQLRRGGREARALIVGEGPEGANLRQLAGRLGLADQVIFTGRVDHAALPSYYGLIDVFVVPRRLEATTDLVTPLKPFEAMAMGKPVVVARTAALSEVVGDGDAGLLFEPDDVGDLAARLSELLSDPERMRSLGETARAWVESERTWARNADRYKQVYRSLGAEV